MMDTDTCIYLRKRRPPEVVEKFGQLQPGEVVMSLITDGELQSGARKSVESETAVSNLYRLRELIPVLPMTGSLRRNPQ